MCAWIEVHQSLPTHAKTLEAAALLDIAEAQVVGHVVCLWLWALDNSRDGRLRLDQPRVLARAALWTGDPGRFLDALVAAGFLDDDGGIHDWDDYTGRLMERRERVNEQTRQRMRAYRDRQRVPPASGRNGDGNAIVTRHNATGDALRDAPVTASYAPTVPNRTVPPLPSGRGSARARRASPTPAHLSTDLSTPASLRLYREATGSDPGPAAQKRIAAAVTDEALWELVLGEWMSRGYSGKNVVGLLEWYRGGIPPPNKPATRVPAGGAAANGNSPYHQPQSQQRQPLPPGLDELAQQIGALGGLKPMAQPRSKR